MDFFSLIAAFCVSLSFMLAPCASDQVIVQQSAQIFGDSAVQQEQLTLPLLPKKLKLQQEANVKGSEDEDTMLEKKLESSSDRKEAKKVEKEVKRATIRGTWREWAEGPNKSEYFTMDYSWIRRRRPIHNKDIPYDP